MSLFIQGVGAVSPLGPNATTTWAQLLAGNEAPRKTLPNGMNGRESRLVVDRACVVLERFR